MHKAISILSTIALVGMTSLSAMAPALADDNGFGSSHPNMAGNDTARGANGVAAQQQLFVGNWCSAHPYDPSCQDFRVHHNRWNHDQYQSWYQSHHTQNGFDPLAAGIFGFAAGAIIAGAANSDNEDRVIDYGDDHVAACQQAYRSYDFRTDTYLGYDNYRHQCQL